MGSICPCLSPSEELDEELKQETKEEAKEEQEDELSSDEVSASNEVNTSRESTKVKFKIDIEKAFQGNGKVSQNG